MSENLKIGKLSLALATFNLQELIVEKFDSKSSWFHEKIFLQKFISKEPRGSAFLSLPRAK